MIFIHSWVSLKVNPFNLKLKCTGFILAAGQLQTYVNAVELNWCCTGYNIRTNFNMGFQFEDNPLQMKMIRTRHNTFFLVLIFFFFCFSTNSWWAVFPWAAPTFSIAPTSTWIRCSCIAAVTEPRIKLPSRTWSCGRGASSRYPCCTTYPSKVRRQEVQGLSVRSHDAVDLCNVRCAMWIL